MTAAERKDRGAAERRHDTGEPIARLRWRLAACRRSAIRGVEDCIARIAALRRQTEDATLDALLDGFRSVRAGLRAMDPSGPIAPAAVQALADRLCALQAEFGRYAAAVRPPLGPS